MYYLYKIFIIIIIICGMSIPERHMEDLELSRISYLWENQEFVIKLLRFRGFFKKNSLFLIIILLLWEVVDDPSMSYKLFVLKI